MVGTCWWVILTSIFLSIAACSQGGDTHPSPRYGAWVTYWDFTAGMKAVNDTPLLFKDVYFFSTVLTPDGRPILFNPGLPYADVVTTLTVQGVQTWMTAVNDVVTPTRNNSTLKDPDIIHQILIDDQRRASHCQDLIQLALQLGFSGIDIDYENLYFEDKTLFTRFIRELSAAVKPEGLKLSVTVQQKNREKNSPGAGAMDWPAICRSTEQMQIMLYNLHNRYTDPGPMATISWIDSIMQYASAQCPVEKIIPVLKVSGMKWGNGVVQGVQYQELLPVLSKYSDSIKRTTDGTPYLKYTDPDGTYTVYYEDKESLLNKVYGLHDSGYYQITFWSLGRHDFDLHKGLSE